VARAKTTKSKLASVILTDRFIWATSEVPQASYLNRLKI
jgi:hypothetical protein